MKLHVRSWFGLLKESAKQFGSDKAPRLAAALAYYTLFSIAPLFLIAIAIAGLAFGKEAARGEIFANIRGLVGNTGAAAIQTMIQNADKHGTGTLSAIVGFVTLILGATGVFGQLRDSLNTIWNVPPVKHGGMMRAIREKILSFGFVVGVGFLLLVSLLISTALSALGKYFSRLLPLGAPVWQSVNFVVSLAVITVVFAAIYKFLPDLRIAWRDVWIGAFFTAVLFVVGEIGIGLYLGRSSVSSAYGAGGSLVILLVWVYYSGLILFFGAEFTEVWSRAHGSLASQQHAAKGGQPVDHLPPVIIPRPAHATRRVAHTKTGKAAPIAAGVAGLMIGGLAASVLTLLGVAKGATKLVSLPFRQK